MSEPQVLTLPAELDLFVPPRGPCAFCNTSPPHDARHRLLDAIVDRFMGGDSPAALASDYTLPPKAINLILVHYPPSDDV